MDYNEHVANCLRVMADSKASDREFDHAALAAVVISLIQIREDINKIVELALWKERSRTD